MKHHVNIRHIKIGSNKFFNPVRGKRTEMQINAAVCALIPPLEKFPVRLVGETEVEREGKVYRMIRLLGNQTSGKRRQSTTVGGDQVIVEYKNGGAWKEIVSIVGRRKV